MSDDIKEVVYYNGFDNSILIKGCYKSYLSNNGDFGVGFYLTAYLKLDMRYWTRIGEL